MGWGGVVAVVAVVGGRVVGWLSCRAVQVG